MEAFFKISSFPLKTFLGGAKVRFASGPPKLLMDVMAALAFNKRVKKHQSGL